MWIRRILWGLLAVTVAACTATSISVRCSNPDEGDVTVCDLDMQGLNSTWSQTVSSRLDEATAGRLSLAVTVETGVVRVSFVDAGGERIEYEVTAETPLDVAETVQIDDGGARVAFEALGGPATGIIARLELGPGN
ncbi:MAG: hypothetical protein IT320_02600 [Anaerolineae bacterium]|nr:hypothetical protein [Anaerolineae bacterium]